MQKLPRLLHFLINLLGINLLIMSLFRMAFWIYFNNPSDAIPSHDLFYSFYLGLKYDLRLALLIILPLFLVGGFRWFSPFESTLMRRFWFTYLGSVFCIVLLFYFMHFGYFAYLQTPMNATVLRFAYNFSTSAQMMWETYPMVWLSLGLALLIAAYIWLLHHLLIRAAMFANPHFHGWKKFGLIAVSFSLVILGLYGKFSYYPLRWSDAFTTAHAFAPAVTVNPILYFANTLKNKNIRFDEDKTRQAYPRMAEFLGVDPVDPQGLNFKREVNKAGPLSDKRPNIVMVFLESFASYKTGVFGNPLNPTPNFDAMANNGLSFTRYYTPHTGTARSVFTTLTGIPDVETNKTSSRNPLVVDQHTIINAFEGYEKLYFLGGSANWGNIRGVLQRNIPGLQVFEEGSYQAERVDVWGISDLSLFEEAHQVLKSVEQPFFAIIQTSGNHRPYTIPEHNRGFSLVHHDDDTYKQAGFTSNGEFNSFRFMDHSLGLFMQDARSADYFANTIFVFFGDHGITGYAGKHTAEFESKYLLSGFHTPMVIYSPKLIPQAKRFDLPASTVDLLPTLAGLAAPGYTNTTLGRDLLDPTFDPQRYAFTITHHSVPEIGLIGPDYYFRMQADGRNKLLAHTAADNALENVIEKDKAVAEEMEALTRGIFDSASYMLFHNQQPTRNEETLDRE